MNRRTLPLAALAILASTGCATTYEDAASDVRSATIVDRNGNTVGTANFYSQADEVTVSVSLSRLSEGTHAVHLHTTGDCSASDFTSAGGHLNPMGNQHGSLNPQGAHLGDLPNAEISSSGSGTVSAVLNGPAETVLSQIFDADGTAVVVHEGPDDYRSDPAGAAGSRIACGVVSPS